MGGGGLKKLAPLALGPVGAAYVGYNIYKDATEGPKKPASAKALEKKAAEKTESRRLAKAGAKAEHGQTKFASAPSMGMNLKKKMGA